MNGLIRKIIRAVGLKWLTGQVRAAAEGKLGPRWQAIYWSLAGAKRVTGLSLAVAAGIAAAVDQPAVATALGAVGTALISLGFVDANWRTEADSDWLKDSAVWKVLANNAPVLTAALAAALPWLRGTSCSLGDWCARGAIAVTAVGAVLVQIGIVDAAWKAAPPVMPPTQ